MTLGKHTIIDFYDCHPDLLDDVEALERILLEAADIAKATIINSQFHQFSPQGVSGTIIIAESHLNIHTWPEHNYAALDLFTCGKDLDSEAAVTYLKESLKAKRSHVQVLDRGNLLASQSQ